MDRPDCDIEPITLEAESAAVVKKIRIASSTMSEVRPVSGRFSSMSNMTFSPEPSGTSSCPLRFIHTAVPPKTTNQAAEISDGAKITTVTNWRRVLPLEILAMNMPTKGDQEIHHAQYIIVQPVAKAPSASPWLGATESMASRLSTKA